MLDIQSLPLQAKNLDREGGLGMPSALFLMVAVSLAKSSLRFIG